MESRSQIDSFSDWNLKLRPNLINYFFGNPINIKILAVYKNLKVIELHIA